MFGIELLFAVVVLVDPGPDAAAYVVAGVLGLSGLQAYLIFEWPFFRMMLEQLTRAAVLVSVAVIGIFWGVDKGHEVLNQWLACFLAGGAGLLGLATLRYLDDRQRERSQRAALAALVEAQDHRSRSTTPPHRPTLVAAIVAGFACGTVLGQRTGRRTRTQADTRLNAARKGR
jgi:hypothetical protein